MNDSKGGLYAALVIKWTVITFILVGFIVWTIPQWQEALQAVAIGAAIIGVILFINVIGWAFETVSKHNYTKRLEESKNSRPGQYEDQLVKWYDQ